MKALGLTILISLIAAHSQAQNQELISKAQLLYDAMQYSEALNMLETTRDKEGGFEYHFLKGNILQKMEKYVGAIQQYEKAIRENPASALAHAFCGAAYLNLQQNAEAEKHLRKALKTDPTLPEAQYFNGNLKYNEFSLNQALKHYDEALKRRPDYRDALYMRGATYAEMGKYREALRDYEAALRVDPDLVLARYNMALVYLEVEQYLRASEILQNIEPESIPRQGEYFFHLAEALYFAGQKETACIYYATAAAHGDAESNDIHKRYCIERQTREALRKKRVIRASF